MNRDECFCFQCEAIIEPINTCQTGNPEDEHIVCPRCGEDDMTDDVADVIDWYKTRSEAQYVNILRLRKEIAEYQKVNANLKAYIDGMGK